MSGILDPRVRAALHALHGKLHGTPIAWVITGSLGLAVRGINVFVHDIDVQTDRFGAYEIERLFRDRVVRAVQFRESPRIRSHFGAIRLEEVEVEIMGDVQHRREDGEWELPPDLARLRDFARFGDIRVPTLPLEHELAAYRKLARRDKIEILERHLGSRR